MLNKLYKFFLELFFVQPIKPKVDKINLATEGININKLNSENGLNEARVILLDDMHYGVGGG